MTDKGNARGMRQLMGAYVCWGEGHAAGLFEGVCPDGRHMLACITILCSRYRSSRRGFAHHRGQIEGGSRPAQQKIRVRSSALGHVYGRVHVHV